MLYYISILLILSLMISRLLSHIIRYTPKGLRLVLHLESYPPGPGQNMAKLYIWNPDFWYMYGICMVYTIHMEKVYTIHMEMSSICMVYVWYMYGISKDIPYICIQMDIPCISKDIHGIS